MIEQAYFVVYPKAFTADNHHNGRIDIPYSALIETTVKVSKSCPSVEKNRFEIFEV